MSCKLDKELLQDLLEGSIDPIERVFVEEHLISCKECRKELTEYKLLFWELDDKYNFEVSLPKELEDLKGAILGKFAEPESVSASKMLFHQQKNVLQTSGKFLEFVPAAKKSEKLLKDGVKATPTVLSSVSKGVLKGAKILLAR